MSTISGLLKREGMKRLYLLIIGLGAVMALLPTRVFSADMNDIAGDRVIQISETLKVSKSGSESLPGDGAWTFGKTDSAIAKTVCPLFGLAFSPYRDGQSPNWKTPIGAEQIRQRLGVIAGYAGWIRTFGMLDGLEKIPRIAKTEFGLKVAAGIWLDQRYNAENEAGLQNLITAAQKGYVDVAVIGNETLLFKRLDTNEEENANRLIVFIQRFRQAVPGVPVTTADNYENLLNHRSVMAACDQIFVNIYPFHQQVPVAEAVGLLAGHYFETKTAAAGKRVVISETGWPSCGNPNGGAIASPENAARYFKDFISWAEGENVPYFYFEAFCELWKSEEGTVGPCWGVWSKEGVLKPGMQPVFDCAAASID
jgi:exo-beta-1,3-glucanase (GH17 family)